MIVKHKITLDIHVSVSYSPHPMNGYITTIEAGKRLGVSDSRVRQLVLNGTLSAQKVGNAVLLIPIEEVSRLKRQRAKSTKRRAIAA